MESVEKWLKVKAALRAARIENSPESLHRLRTAMRQAREMQADVEVE